MIADLIEARLRAGARRGLRQLLLGLAGGAMLAVGLGFATAAGWIALAEAFGPLIASVALAGGYGLVGLVLLALAAQGDGSPTPRQETGRQRDAPPRSQSDDPLSQVAAAFSEGYAAGRKLRGGTTGRGSG